MSELKYTATQMNNVMSSSREYYTNWKEAEATNKMLTARIAELEAEIERITVHSDIERQDDSNDTQTQTVVYGKESEG